MRIYYLIPEAHPKAKFSLLRALKSIKNRELISYLRRCFLRMHKPIGGIKVIYQHCLMLRKLGYEVHPVRMGSYEGNFYGYDIECKTYAEVAPTVTSSDIVVATEFRPYEGLLFKQARKVLFLQNWIGIQLWLKEEDKAKSYLDLGYDYVITCSEYCTNFVAEQMNIPAITITNGIDLDKFKPLAAKRVGNRILAMSRKKPENLEKIIALMEGSRYTFQVIDGLTQEELIKEYQAADIFLATGYPEGFGLPPLEAMACGCMVVGFTGGGANEFMLDNETALVAADGDVETVVEKLRLLQDNNELKETIRARGYQKALAYDLSATEKQLETFYQRIAR